MKILYVTCKDKEEASKISKHCVERKLAVCGNSFPISSCYFWEDKIQNDDEFVILLKTSDTLSEQLKLEVAKIHSYAVPCILEFDVKANKEYEKWMLDYLSS